MEKKKVILKIEVVSPGDTEDNAGVIIKHSEASAARKVLPSYPPPHGAQGALGPSPVGRVSCEK